ncbi:H-NS histone [Paraburkholderia bannensis]|uniref:H-NS histone n=1 Tax=Paraburkholderia bannensis TaxID=765414 RepID=UPI0038B7898E
MLDRLREDVVLLGITEREIRRALGYDRSPRAPAKHYDPATGKKWSSRGARPTWLADERIEDCAIDAPQPQPWWPGDERGA